MPDTKKESLWDLTKENLKDGSTWFFLLCLFWTLGYVAMLWVSFFLPVYQVVQQIFASFYLPLLSFYAGDKELGRWFGKKTIIARPGEFLVYLLWLTPLGMFVINFFTENRYKIPPDTQFICLFVLSIFVATDISKRVKERRDGENGEKTDRAND